MPQFLAGLKAMGFSGVQNFPSVGLFDGTMRVSFEETGMGFGLEIDMIAQAHQLDLLTTPYVFNPTEAQAMAEAGADVIVAHMGVTTGGSIGATSAKTLQACVAEIDAISEAVSSVRRDVIVLCHGGPIATPPDAEFILRNSANCHGFYGASSMERLPVEIALTDQTRSFKSLTFEKPREQ
jgi:predicted TIM-barrel enzyme